MSFCILFFRGFLFQNGKSLLTDYLSLYFQETSVNGVGTLIIRNAQPSDAGAYTCEAINNQNAIFGNPDAIVTVNGGMLCEIIGLHVF